MRHGIFVISAILFIMLCPMVCVGQDSGVEERLYNFDDMLIDGAFRDPQGMFERARAEARFEGVLDLQRSFMEQVEGDAQESSMRP